MQMFYLRRQYQFDFYEHIVKYEDCGKYAILNTFKYQPLRNFNIDPDETYRKRYNVLFPTNLEQVLCFLHYPTQIIFIIDFSLTFNNAHCQ